MSCRSNVVTRSSSDSLPVNFGALLLLIPGLYLKGRLLPVGPAFVAERPLGTLAAWRRSFALTRGHGLVLMALATIPLGRVAEPEEIAWPIAFLASDRASFVTGEIFNVNGGAVLVG